MTSPADLIEDLVASGARFHGWAPDVEVTWQLNRPTLDLLAEVLGPGQRTLETGVGYSTIVFAAAGTSHTAVSPLEFEHDRVRAWCDEHHLHHSSVEFVAQPSQLALPQLEPTPLDVVLIDGDHAFPTPFLDFYYAGVRLVAGGSLIVDDTHLRACRMLREFLNEDAPRWRAVRHLETTSVFERLEGPLLPPEGWEGQPWGASPLLYGPTAGVWPRLRHAIRLRTRLRALRGQRGRR